jgi:hypothetical protein
VAAEFRAIALKQRLPGRIWNLEREAGFVDAQPYSEAE